MPFFLQSGLVIMQKVEDVDMHVGSGGGRTLVVSFV